MIRPDLAPSFEGKRVLITGGLGFIGSNLARELVEMGARVVLVDSLIARVRRPALQRGRHRGPRARQHLRRPRRAQPALPRARPGLSCSTSPVRPAISTRCSTRTPTSRSTCRSQLSILEACRHENPAVKIVFASTRQIYGRPQHLPVDESHPIAPVDVNGVNKVAGEWYHLLYGDVYGMQTTALRLTNTYGPRMRVKDARQTFLGIWLRLALAGRRDPRLRRRQPDAATLPTSTTRWRRSCSRRHARRRTARTYNLGGEGHVSLLELAELVTAAARQRHGAARPVPGDRKSIDIGDFYADFAAIRDATRLAARGLRAEDGLRRTLDFYREHGAHYWDGAMSVPFLDLARETTRLRRGAQMAIGRVLASGRFVLTEEVEAFEREFAALLRHAHAVGVATGTDAIALALLASASSPATR